MLQERAGGEAGAVAFDDFAALLQKEFKPNSDAKQSRIEDAVKTLAQQGLAASGSNT